MTPPHSAPPAVPGQGLYLLGFLLTITKASCAGVRAQLYVTLEVEYWDRTILERLVAQAEEASCLLSGLRTAVERKTAGQHDAR